MKRRRGYITNSSSANFIIGFKDEETLASSLMQDEAVWSPKKIYMECLSAAKMDLETMLNLYRERISDRIWFDLKYSRKMNSEQRKEWTEADEFKKLYEDKLNQRIELFRQECIKKGFCSFVELEYDDYETEYSIAANMECCVAIIDNH